MSDLQKLWDEFLEEWPLERVKKMTLEEYVGFQDKNTFTYCVETKYKPIGNIKGSPSYKFGIFKRNPSKDIKEKSGAEQGVEYSWQSRFGKTEQEAFIEIRNTILTVISAVQSGDMDALENISLANMFKWKIAFLYQRRDEPCVLNIFSNKMLAKLTGLGEQALFSEYYSKLIGNFDKNKFNNIADYGRNCWQQLDNEEESYDSVYWFLGASYGSNDDQTKRFLEEGIWQNGSDGKFIDKVKEIEVGDKIAIKSVYTQTNNLPFDNGGSVASIMDIKAIGVVTHNHGDGETLDIDWQTDFKKRTWYSYTYQPRLWQVFPTNWKRKALIDFTFNNAKQDYSKFINVGSADGLEDKDGSIKLMVNNNSALNSILYGPPGTGKTYHTIEASVKAAEPDFVAELDANLTNLNDRRKELTIKYNELIHSKRIQFVTFHQSYGYEEFVEGLSAKTENEKISYYEKDGIFKEIAQQANDDGDLDKIKLSDALANLADDLSEQSIKLKTINGKIFSVTYRDGDTFRVYPEGSQKDDLLRGYSASFKNITYYYKEKGLRNVHNKSYVRAIVSHLMESYGLPNFDENEDHQVQKKQNNYVLIIDEINRGNISKIFGELITLIEPSKRQGEIEELKVTLPHSRESFSVPKNLYIIGTMNTADRSLAMMDTALRRRFDFKEMMPKPELFENCLVDGVNLTKLLDTMNKRIEVLYDREHMLGHAFLFPVYNAMQAGNKMIAMAALQSTFQNKIIPLLEEYFYEDWSKIRLVLGDNQKSTKQTDLQFVREIPIKYDLLFGASYQAGEYGQPESRYELAPYDDAIWKNAKAYASIYIDVIEPTE